jgi:hypothetical protein
LLLTAIQRTCRACALLYNFLNNELQKAGEFDTISSERQGNAASIKEAKT